MSFFVILLLLLTTGIYGLLHQIPRREIGNSFYRLITLLFLIGMTLVLVSFPPAGTIELLQYGLVLAALATGFLHRYSLATDRSALRALSYWSGVLLTVVLVGTISMLEPLPSLMESITSPAVNFVHLLITAAIMGAIVDAMICGHWYLVNPDLSLTPIRSISRALTAVILLKIALVGWSLFQTSSADPYLYQRVVFMMPILFWVRVLVGLAGGLFFNWMSWKALEHGNTQAATGILYACIVWIILGEFSAFSLTLNTGVPL
jgi:hypothetical protein